MSAEDKDQADTSVQKGAANETLSTEPDEESLSQPRNEDSVVERQVQAAVASPESAVLITTITDQSTAEVLEVPVAAVDSTRTQVTQTTVLDEAVADATVQAIVRKEARGPVSTKRRTEAPQGEDDDESEEEEVVSNEGQEGTDDPMGEAFCLDDGSPIESDEEVLPWRSDVKSPREFFSTEILYRYDILEPSEQEALKGSYRLELKGQEGGIWSVLVTDHLQVENTRNDADIVLSLHRKDFMNIINGRLNPQLAILAQKIRIKGDTRRAVIFQCLLTPTPE